MTAGTLTPPAAAPLRAGKRYPVSLVIGLVGLGFILLLAIVAPMIWGSAAEAGSGDLRTGPSAEHWFGTDSQGRDVLIRTLVATRLTLIMGVIATGIAVVLGGLIGALLVVSGNRVRWFGARAIDLWLALPPIIVALAVTAIFRPNEVTVVIAIGIAFSPQFARLTNNLASSVGAKDFVVTAHLLGVPGPTVLFRHVIPNIASPVLVLTSVCLSTSIITMSGLSFIGLGVQPPAIDWGQLLASGLRDIYQNPSGAIAPSLAIVLTGLSASLIGDGFVALSEPRRIQPRARKVVRAAAPAVPVEINAASTLAAATAAGRAPALDVRDLRVQVGQSGEGAQLVRGISLTVGAGEIVGLVGESGSGKSITAMTAAQLLPPELAWDAASLDVASHALSSSSVPPTALALDLGIVFQDPSSCFNPARKLGAQLTESIRVHKKVPKQEAERLAIQKLREARVTEPELRMRQYPHELSGGMRQRAMIAMALITTPKLLIADEPTTALDVTVQADVLRLIKQINRDHDMAVLLISHDIDVIAAMCDRVYVMYRGEIIEHLTAAQLRDREVTQPYTEKLLAASASTALEGAVYRANANGGSPA
ncbi:dipeptide/oligopeptide/nickel ABC transporter permease/ATP-binding protein [Amnibacterium flavum]|uniref:Peptide ABC transporter ATP-binding protein n=1 Tax=Amnibacterium flavum TaxID=2173173 RepID=A0A2V1HQ91_9MICO|nr:dipeptide/oligopeptide/nickel ABC transporter permease/ATP-binding protein [Amnibacterium flavum]PVZ94786.1 peptide ABC transporter ATP-binding protein [Amnibacterium flavum]